MKDYKSDEGHAYGDCQAREAVREALTKDKTFHAILDKSLNQLSEGKTEASQLDKLLK